MKNEIDNATSLRAGVEDLARKFGFNCNAFVYLGKDGEVRVSAIMKKVEG